MPRWDFECSNPKCKVIVKDLFLLTMKEKDTQVCSVCGCKLEQTIMGGEGSAPGVIYKGGGFHVNDYPTGGGNFKP